MTRQKRSLNFYEAPLDPTTGLKLRHGNGCYYYPNCFTCPIPVEKCKYDFPKPKEGTPK